jgi:AbrB family looped-hinge helix DNA binding protein
MKITTKGQVTIPQHIRERLGLLPNTEVDFEMHEDGVMLKKAKASQRRGRSLIEHMRGRADTGLSTDEIMALTRGDD